MNQGNGMPHSGEIATAFGYVTAEDRARWEQARQSMQNQGDRSAVAEFTQAFSSAMSELGKESIQARLRAAHQVAAQEERDQMKQTRRTITQVETVDIEDREYGDPFGY